jgi:G3E family GTPase
LIEPSGAGHAADIIDELAIYEAQGALTLDSVTCLVDGQDAERIGSAPQGNEWSQIQAADVLLMSKADLAGAAGHEAFAEIAAAQFPAKQFLGLVNHGALPPQALMRYTRSPTWSLVRDTAVVAPQTREFPIAGLIGTETQLSQLGLWAVCWILPPEQRFARVVLEPRIRWLLDAHQTWIRRLKAVFRTGPGPSWMIHSHGRGLAVEDSAYRRDSRLEIVLAAEPTDDFLDALRSALRDAVV